MLWLELYYLRRGRIQEVLIFAEIGYPVPDPRLQA